MKELLHTCEISIERKDGVIANLTRSLQNQKEKFDTLKSFTDWKIRYAESKMEVRRRGIYGATISDHTIKPITLVFEGLWNEASGTAPQSLPAPSLLEDLAHGHSGEVAPPRGESLSGQGTGSLHCSHQ